MLLGGGVGWGESLEEAMHLLYVKHLLSDSTEGALKPQPFSNRVLRAADGAHGLAQGGDRGDARSAGALSARGTILHCVSHLPSQGGRGAQENRGPWAPPHEGEGGTPLSLRPLEQGFWVEPCPTSPGAAVKIRRGRGVSSQLVRSLDVSVREEKKRDISHDYGEKTSRTT